MTAHEQLTHTFYAAFQRKDWRTMAACYHAEARFSDPVFPELRGAAVGTMWQMLLTAGKDLRMEFDAPITEGEVVTCRWRAFYTFSKTGRPVENHIRATLRFRDGKIFAHTDHFDLWKWSRMALGPTGWLLGWSSLVQGKVRALAKKSLEQFAASSSLTDINSKYG